ncbi:MAG: antibiotic biosynthesis monooxygenase [Planctomycetota bacterium]
MLISQVIPMIEAKAMPGYRGIEVLRTERDSETEFITIMTFDSLNHVTAFMGEDYAVAHVPEVAQKVLKRWDQRSEHYELRAEKAAP